MIGILDTGMANIRSVANAVYSIGYDYQIITEPGLMDDLTHLILPGVGAFDAAMARLNEMNMTSDIKAFAASKRPMLGLCLGMQLMAELGDEGVETAGLGFVPGKVTRLTCDLPIPHIGWNSLQIVKDHPVFHKVKSNVDFYFVHSYHFLCDRSEDVLAVTEYGQSFHAVVGRDNVLGFQFHPEKSQGNGLKLLENFCDWNGKG